MGWRLRIEHVTRFTYTSPAMASYNEARMTPLTTVGQMTLDARITVTPAVSVYRYWDYWGAQVVAFDVHEPHDVLAVTARSLIETTAVPAQEGSAQLTWGELHDAAYDGPLAELTVPTPRTAVTEAYTSRKNAGDSSTPKMAIEIHSDGPRTARAASSSTIPGNAISRPATQEETLSNQPP